MAQNESTSAEVTFDQRSPEWFEWRKKGIGSSDASVVMGLNRYKTINQLWLEKTDQVQVDYDNTSFLAARGTRLEPHARRVYEMYTKIKVRDKLCFNKKFPFVKASLDGWSEEFELLLEIKCPNHVNHMKAVHGNVIKPEYYCQMQHQYLASGAKAADYWSFDGQSGHRIPVLPDAWFMGELLEREIEFWNCVQTLTKPDPDYFKAVV